MFFRTFQKPVTVSALTILAGFALSACAATPPPPELLNARQAYIRAESGAAAQVKPDSLHEAKVALDKAEIAYADDPSSQATKDIAYLSLRRSELAEVEARDYLAMQEKSRAERELAGLSQSQLSRTREQLAAASERQTRTEQQLAEERAASERARQMLEKLGATKQERGMVITLPGGILFQTAQTTVLPGAQDKLTVVAQAIKEADRDVLIEGHTDSQGSVEMNMKLSESRAESVRDFLVSQGAPVNRIRTAGVGESRPMADNSTAEGRAQNRRVEIIVAPFESKTERKPSTVDEP